LSTLATLFLLALLAGCGRETQSPPSALSRFPDHLSNPQLEPSGVFSDGWVAETAAVNLEHPAGRRVLVVRGTVPEIDRPEFRTNLRVSIDGREVARQPLGTGDFSIEAPAGEAAGRRRVTLAFDSSQQLPDGDGRTVAARLSFLGFEYPSAKSRLGAEIVHAPGVRLGSGWNTLETFKNETFRWVANDAQFFVEAAAPERRRFRLTVEPGPGVGGKPFVLEIRDASGRQVDAVEVRRRETVQLFVPLEGGRENEFRFHVEGGGRSAPNDQRILNFRVLRIESADS
jgi:hypothetical protein